MQEDPLGNPSGFLLADEWTSATVYVDTKQEEISRDGDNEYRGLKIIADTFAGDVITGSNKRGAMYGLFHISERIGVSVWVYMADAAPVQHSSVYLDPGLLEFNRPQSYLSKEPSVKYRGFFINDESPSFNGWPTQYLPTHMGYVWGHPTTKHATVQESNGRKNISPMKIR